MRSQQTRDVPLSRQLTKVKFIPIPHKFGERWHFEPLTLKTNDIKDSDYNEGKTKRNSMS